MHVLIFFVSFTLYRRAKLYQFSESLLNKGSGTKSWNERGLGQIKLLK